MRYIVITSLFLVMLITPVMICAQTATNQGDTDTHRRSAREIFRELVEINTTTDSGSTKAAEAMAVRLRDAGFPQGDIQVVGPQAQHMNLIVRYRGKSTRPPILFIGHLDVVPALRQDWSFDPFRFQETEGYFYGRGTTDMKDNDAGLVANLIRLKKEGFIPDRDIIVALTDDEEGGGANGIEWLLLNRREFIDAEYCVNPDGGGGTTEDGKEVVLIIQTSEKIYLDYTLKAQNKGGHSSLPVRDNAIYHLSEALLHIADYNFPVSLNETTRMFFARKADQETGQVRSDMLAVSKVPVDLAAAERLAKVSPYYNSQIRTTCVATMLSGGHAQNALPQSATANVNCRMLPGETTGNVTATLKKIINDPEIEVTCTYASTVSPLSPLRDDVVRTVDNLAASMWPGVIVIPSMTTGATDGRLLRAAGIPVYGISGMFADMEDVRAHGRDERIGVKEFYNGVEFMYRLMKALTSGS
ncbi:MAG: M20/M25/M40 family metallo-hydrolase [Bacteroidales bacterium]|nr:M20/M25/M40 family metallo-hydrolase [Bacteroidales bacterium]